MEFKRLKKILVQCKKDFGELPIRQYMSGGATAASSEQLYKRIYKHPLDNDIKDYLKKMGDINFNQLSNKKINNYIRFIYNVSVGTETNIHLFEVSELDYISADKEKIPQEQMYIFILQNVDDDIDN